jgi:putative redox protein
MKNELAPSSHTSSIFGSWSGGFNGHGTLKGMFSMTSIGLPKEFGGIGNKTTPEDLLLSAVASCYLATFGIILDKAGVNYVDLAIVGELKTDIGPPAAIREIVLRPSITTDAESALIERLAQRIDGFCVVSQALNPSLKKTVHLQLNKATASRSENQEISV